jgi:hypothetical protein
VASQIVGSSFANGAMFPNYVNGRLLAAEDLSTMQATLLERDAMTGQAAGTGVVNGLWVTASASALTVQAGRGIAPAGQPVCVPAQITLQLSIAGPPATPAGGTFASCTTTTSSQAAIAAGLYLLTALPACQTQGMAPMAIPPGSDTPVACVAQWLVEGVQFKAIPLSLGTDVAGVVVSSENTRNLLAHRCFGTDTLALLGADPFTLRPPYRGIDRLASADFTPCDLPLCVFQWDGGTVVFVDNWSARRRITRPDVSAASWSEALADQRSADGEARFLQFQDQIADLVAAGVSSTTAALPVFGILPPVGFLPVPASTMVQDIANFDGVNGKTAATRKPGGDILSPQVLQQAQKNVALLGPQSGFTTFFNDLKITMGGIISWDTTYFALRESYHLSAFNTDLAQIGPFFLDVIYYYYVLENCIAVFNWLNNGTPPVTPYRVFINSQVWYPTTLAPFIAPLAAPL